MKQSAFQFFIQPKIRKRMADCFLLALLMICISLPLDNAAQAQNLDEWQSPTYILKAFNEIALKNEYRSTAQRILKWQQPIYYRFQYHDLPQNTMVENLFSIHLKHLAEITKHNIQPSGKHKANLLIHITRDRHYNQVIRQFTSSNVSNIARESHCMGSFKTHSDAISEAQIVLPVDHLFSKGLLVSCIVEETTQVMGLPNDSDWVNPSIANDVSKIELLTGLDYLFLTILYDRQIKAGMSRKRSQPIIKAIITQLQQQGIIDNAQHLVNKGGLNAYLE
ncbi:DUF2927 domain-containing protein [Thiomicrorhabdus sediminis]|uniref:DUF2927 domain-containing protein n=1 Tax=Thiomicrorhabdus sediminis TaxID=2580412 RepID=A0A4P9K5C7_9GAMM|nr:DUF2927 domain-containing protein [Thiomicrorhabdus sediminis]QCU89437.1 DUF2927 domain-containing protein [Thiomicrorhabdus sediminis]